MASYPATHAGRAVPAAPVQIDPDLLPAIVGPIGNSSILRPGHALPLCALNNPSGLLLISKDHIPVVVLDACGGLALLYAFPQSAPFVWDLVAQIWPDVRPGQSFARFCVLEEGNEYAFTPHYSLLDLEAMDVLVQAPRAHVEALCKEANRDAEAVLHRLAVAETMHALRTTTPQLAGIMAEQVWTNWERRLEVAPSDASLCARGTYSGLLSSSSLSSPWPPLSAYASISPR